MHTATGMVHSRDTDLGPLILLGPTLHSHIFVIDDHQGSHAAYPYQLLLYFFLTAQALHVAFMHGVCMKWWLLIEYLKLKVGTSP